MFWGFQTLLCQQLICLSHVAIAQLMSVTVLSLQTRLCFLSITSLSLRRTRTRVSVPLLSLQCAIVTWQMLCNDSNSSTQVCDGNSEIGHISFSTSDSITQNDTWDVARSLHVQLLTHWGRVAHICISNLTIIGSDNGLSPGRRQAIIWTQAGIFFIGLLGTNFSEILIEILTFSFKKMCLKVSSAKWRPFCLGLYVLKQNSRMSARFHAVLLINVHRYMGQILYVGICIQEHHSNLIWMITVLWHADSWLWSQDPTASSCDHSSHHNKEWCYVICLLWYDNCGLVRPYGNTDRGQHWLR